MTPMACEPCLPNEFEFRPWRGYLCSSRYLSSTRNMMAAPSLTMPAHCSMLIMESYFPRIVCALCCRNQCTNQNLELFSKALYPIRYLASLYVFVAGCIIAGNIHLAQGFGRGMTAIGAFLIFCCFWNLGSATLMHAGMKRHNKCIILAVRGAVYLCTG